MSSFEKKILAKRIRERLNDKGMTQRELAEVMEVSPQTVNAWVRKDNSSGAPDINTIFVLAKTLGCSVSFLIGEIDTLQPEVSAIQQCIGLSEKSIDKLVHYTTTKEKLNLSLFDAFIAEDKLLIEGLESYIEFLRVGRDLYDSKYYATIKEAFRQFNSDGVRLKLILSSLDIKSFLQFPWEYGEGLSVEEEQFLVLLYWGFLRDFNGDKERANNCAINSVKFLHYLEGEKYRDIKKYELVAKYASVLETLSEKYVNDKE